MKDQERLAALESQMSTLVNSQKEFTSKALQMLALGTKKIYSKEEAALFLNLDPDYLYQLKHHGKLKARLQTFRDYKQTENQRYQRNSKPECGKPPVGNFQSE